MQTGNVNILVDGCNYDVEDIEIPELTVTGPTGKMLPAKKIVVEIPRGSDGGALVQLAIVFSPEQYGQWADFMQRRKVVIARSDALGKLNGLRPQ